MVHITSLKKYIEILQPKNLIVENDISGETLCNKNISLVTCDSRAVIPGTLFICKGAHFDVSYLRGAGKAGAVCYISESRYDVDIPGIIVSDVRLAMALLADFYYGHPSASLDLTGITGTKGKSSTAYFLRSILDDYMMDTCGKRSGVISSIDTYDGVEDFESHLTTPEPLDLEKHLSNAIDSGINYVTMEVSSQALKYDRVTNVDLETAVFLNIGTDHISPAEHVDFEDYFSSKLLIFRQAKNAVVNVDSKFHDRIISSANDAGCQLYTFSMQDETADVYAYGVVSENNGNNFMISLSDRMAMAYKASLDNKFKNGIIQNMSNDSNDIDGCALAISLPGRFNVENALAAIAVSLIYGIPAAYIKSGLKKATVPGRMEVFQSRDRSITAIVDYAHNQLSFETLFKTVQEEYPGHSVIAVFGCPGGKAYARRQQLPAAAGKYCDMIYVTEEDAGEDPVEEISAEIARNIEPTGCNYDIINDRGDAIRAALSYSKRPLVACITGKGRETRQKRGIQYIDCMSDVEYVEEFLKDYDSSSDK